MKVEVLLACPALLHAVFVPGKWNFCEVYRDVGDCSHLEENISVKNSQKTHKECNNKHNQPAHCFTPGSIMILLRTPQTHLFPFSYNLDLTPFTQCNLQSKKKLYLVLMMRHGVSVWLYVCALLVSLSHYEMERRDEIAWHHNAFTFSYLFLPCADVRLCIHLIKEAEMQ